MLRGSLKGGKVNWILKAFGWTDIWVAGGGSLSYVFAVGLWTGPNKDLICVRPARSRVEAEYYLSPMSRSLIFATIKAIIKYLFTPKLVHDIGLKTGQDI